MATDRPWLEPLRELNPQALTADGLDEAYIGFIENRWVKDGAPIAVYSRRKCIMAFMKMGMCEADAEEFFEFNVIDAYVGPHTPMFLIDREEE